MLVYLFALLLLALLVLLYRYLPNRRVFACFCLTRSPSRDSSHIPAGHGHSRRLSSVRRSYDIQQQQQIFAAWYGKYQKDLKQLD